MRTDYSLCKAFLLLSILLTCTHALSQQRGRIHGRVMNDFTKEPIPFASIFWKKAGFGITSDSAGNFVLSLSHHPIDTLVTSYVGFSDIYKVFRNTSKDTTAVELVMRELKLSNT